MKLVLRESDSKVKIISLCEFDKKFLPQNVSISFLTCVGQSTPEYLKKGWKINFSKFSEDGQFFGLDALGLKYPYPDDSMLRNQLYMDFNRALNVPVFRAR
jgi:hypothetical protein